MTAAARQLNIAPSSCCGGADGFVAGEQVTPGAPWRIRLTDQLRGMLTDTAPGGWVPLGYATQALGVSRQTVLQKVKRGELNAVLTRTGRRKGLRIEVPAPNTACSDTRNQLRSSMTMDPSSRRYPSRPPTGDPASTHQ